MQRDINIEIKTKKTWIVFGAANIAMSPLLLIDTQLGVTAMLALNSFLLYQLHGLGKSRRPGSNAVNNVSSFFSSQVNAVGSDVDNSYRNVINGGAAVFDELVMKLAR